MAKGKKRYVYNVRVVKEVWEMTSVVASTKKEAIKKVKNGNVYTRDMTYDEVKKVEFLERTPADPEADYRYKGMY